MTTWIPDVVPHEPIESEWGNAIRDRTVTPFANAAARSAAIPVPIKGMVSMLADTGAVEYYYGTALGWRPPWNTAWGRVDGPFEFTRMATVAIGSSFVTNSFFTLPLAGRRYAIHATATTLPHNFATNLMGVSFAVQQNTGVSAYADRVDGSGGTPTSYSEYQPMHLCGIAVATLTPQGGACVISPFGAAATLESGRVWAEDVGPGANPVAAEAMMRDAPTTRPAPKPVDLPPPQPEVIT